MFLVVFFCFKQFLTMMLLQFGLRQDASAHHVLGLPAGVDSSVERIASDKWLVMSGPF